MSKFLATFLSAYQSPADGEGSDLGGSGALDIESRISNALDTGNEGANDTVDADGEDGEDLPEDGDAETEDESADSDDDQATLASALGLDDDKLAYDDAGNVVFNATIDGEIKPVKMQDLIKSYQLEGHVTQKSMRLESDRREFETTRDQAYGELTKRLDSANAILALAEQTIMQEYQTIDWNTLRATDPGEFAALRQYYSERMQVVEQAKAQAGQGKTKLTAEQQQQADAQKHQRMNQEISKMIVDNPTWSDQAVMAKEVGEIGVFLNSQYGFSPEEIAEAMDSRLMRLIRDAHAFKSGKQALTTKKVPDNVPKFRKPGSQNVNRGDVSKAREAKAVKDNIRRTGGNVDSIAAALLKRM